MLPRRLLLGATLACLLVGAAGLWLFLRQREASCAPVQALARQLLPNAAFAEPGDVPGLPAGWQSGASGVELRGPAVGRGEGFDLDGDGRALQLIGVGNYVQTPATLVEPGARYCLSAFALTDSPQGSPTRARLVFEWRDAEGEILRQDTMRWQLVALWTPEDPPRDWSHLRAASRAPVGAATLVVRVEPASDDRIYLDRFALYKGGDDLPDLRAINPQPDAELPRVARWPLARRAAVAFTFDWETSMGGLVHSRSVDDPNFTDDHVQRGLRMREGITNTLEIFAPLDIRATYYATGYNFLLGNVERRNFLGDPTFPWATRANGWTSDRWTTTPWFADDPYGTIASEPAWYFGDLVPPLLDGGHEIQSHTFAHIHGGLSDLATWQLDLQTWNNIAAERGVPPASSLAFPWSSSAGMSDAAWGALERAGITSVTRLSDQAQYSLWATDADGIFTAPRCRWLPGREGSMLACPDFYLTPERLSLALRQIERAVEAGGMIDLWAHTEEVTSPEQITAWRRVAGRVAEDSRLWVAPLSEIAAWQAALAQVQLQRGPSYTEQDDGALRFTVKNYSNSDLNGFSLHMPAATQRITVNGDELERAGRRLPRGTGWWPAAGIATIDLAAGQSVEVAVWLAP